MKTKHCMACGTETNLVSGLGGVLLCHPCRSEIEGEVAELRAAGKEVDVTVMARRIYNRLHDNTRTARTNRRNEQLNQLAREIGFDSLSQMLTAWMNGRIEIRVKDAV